MMMMMMMIIVIIIIIIRQHHRLCNRPRGHREQGALGRPPWAVPWAQGGHCNRCPPWAVPWAVPWPQGGDNRTSEVGYDNDHDDDDDEKCSKFVL